jgi:subtilisin family serine protease
VARGWCSPAGAGILSCMRPSFADRRTSSLLRRVAVVTLLGVAAGSAAVNAREPDQAAAVDLEFTAVGDAVGVTDAGARIPVRAGELMSYVLNAAPGTASTTRAATAARSAGGTVVQSWPAIGVLVVHSTSARFRTTVLAAAGRPVQSVGATRTIAVAEGTPGTDRRPPRPKTGGGDPLSRLYVGPRRAAVKDPREAEQWDMKQIKADQAHQVTDGSRDVVVGVLDSGVESTHPDLKANLDLKSSVSCVDAGRPDTTPGAAEPTNSTHGTHVAGTIAAARNGIGIVGVAPGVKLASVKVVNDAGSIYPEYAICGFMWAGMRKFDVTNNSYFVDPWQFWCDNQADQKAVAVAVGRAVAWSRKQGVVSAAAAGNSAMDLAKKTVDSQSPNDSTPVSRPIGQQCHDLPAELPGVVTVSSTTRAVARSSFSNFGAKIIDVAAPGSDVLSTVTGGGYSLLSGTSMASPHVAGVLALLKGKHPAATPDELVKLLRGQAQDTACPKPAGACTGSAADNGYFGDGVVDAKGAVTARVSGR